MRQYVGARYIPKFMGLYNATQAYEALCVVDNGMGTSYITKVPTPAGTPLTDTDHYAVYGTSSGAIINLQNQIGDLTNLTTTDQDSLVDAINEVDADIQTLMSRGVSVTDFGAKGDGVTNDTTAFVNAIAAAKAASPNLRGAIFIPAGNYLIDGITIDNGTSIYGVGDDSVLIGNDKTKPVIECTNDLRVLTIYGLHIKYKDTVISSDTSAVGIKCTAMGQGCKIIHCYFNNVYDAIKTSVFIGWIDHIFVQSAVHNGIDVGNGNFYVTNSYIENCGNHGYSTNGHTGGLYINNCLFYKCRGNGINVNVSGDNHVYNAVITNNVVSATLGHGIYFISNDGFNHIIADNWIEYSGFSEETNPPTESANMYGIVFEGDNSLIQGNVISVSMNANMLIHGSHLDVCDNNCEYPGQHISGQNVGILLDNACDYFNIHHNDLRHNARGILKNGGTITKGLINYNVIDESLDAVSIYGTVSGCNFEHNISNIKTAVTTPAMPAANVGVVNNTGYDVYVTFNDHTLAGNIYVNNVSIGGTMPLILLKAGASIAMAYATAPTWTWTRV